MATTSPVPTTFASKTTPKLPFPMIRSAEYEMLLSTLLLELDEEDGSIPSEVCCSAAAADVDDIEVSVIREEEGDN